MNNLFNQKANFPEVKIEGENQVVSARDLYNFLEVSEAFTDWFLRMKGYGFTQNVDYQSLSAKSEKLGGRPSTDYALTIETAKEIAMIQRTEIGKKVREYFIECERQLKIKKISDRILTPDVLINLATQLKGEMARNEELTEQLQMSESVIKAQAPKVKYVDEVLAVPNTWTTTTIAKELSMTAQHLNKILCDLKIQFPHEKHYVLYAKYQNKDYTRTRTATFIDGSGVTRSSLLMSWTEKGRMFIHQTIQEMRNTEIIPQESKS
ncbi:MAG: antA/AntB antirepressor family protein [Saprospiraceae bacterium]|nr:antA/AntB antirepressor family protein [Candidatus Vicinibacter affinis]